MITCNEAKQLRDMSLELADIMGEIRTDTLSSMAYPDDFSFVLPSNRAKAAKIFSELKQYINSLEG